MSLRLVSDLPDNVIPFPSRRPEEMLSIRDLAARYGVSERWLRYRVAEGMPRHRWGSMYRYKPSEVEAWMGAQDAK